MDSRIQVKPVSLMISLFMSACPSVLMSTIFCPLRPRGAAQNSAQDVLVWSFVFLYLEVHLMHVIVILHRMKP